MSAQLDWVGGQPPEPQRAFKDIRNTRPSVAEEKAELSLRLGVLCNRVPEAIRSASVNRTNEWRNARAAAVKVLNNKRASVQELTAAISNMERLSHA